MVLKTRLIPANFTYLELTDWTGRCVNPKKKGCIPDSTPKILSQLGMDESIWLETVSSFQSKFYTFIGSEQQLKTTCEKNQKKWTKGLSLCKRLFATTEPISI